MMQQAKVHSQGAKKCIIVVLGMHRSGTSVIAHGLQTLGVDLGDNLMPPVAGNNDKGFFEDLDVYSLNMEILNAIDSDWDALSLLPVSLFNHENMKPFKLRATELMNAKMGSEPFGLKDPRMVRLLPFWSSVMDSLDVRVTYVISVRHPMSVAKSLQKRDAIDCEKGYYLWLEHVLPTVLETVGANRVVVGFDLMMSSPKAQLERIANALKLPFNPDSPTIKQYISTFLDDNLRHTQFNVDDLHNHSEVPSDVIIAYKLLLRLANDEINIDDLEVEATFGQLRTRLHSVAPLLNYLTRIDNAQVPSLKQGIADLNQGVAALRNELKGRDDSIAALQSELTGRDDSIAGLQSALTGRNDSIAGLQSALKGRDDSIAAILSELTGRDDSIATLQSELTSRDDRLYGIYNSTSWKITRPLRSIKEMPLRLRNVVQRWQQSGEKSNPIILVTHDANRAGAQYLSLAIAKSLKRAGFNTHHIICGGGPLMSDFSRSSITYDISYHENDPEKITALINKLRIEGCTLAICNTTVTGWVSRLLKIEGYKVIGLVHELSYVIEKLNLQNNAKLMAECSDVVVFPAPLVRDTFADYADLNLTKVIIKPQGLFRMNRYLDKQDAIAVQLRKSLSLKNNIKIVLCCGYGDSRKGIDIFVETAIHSIGVSGDVAFVWLGSIAPEMKETLLKRVNSCSSEVKRNIIFMGEISESHEYEKFMAGSDLFFLSSREDPFPSVVLDAMSVGVPVVAFDGCGGFSEELRGVIELLPSLDPVEASAMIKEIIHNKNKYKEMSQCGQKEVHEKYDFEKYISFIVDTITKV
ncbi:MAG: glycosyltransferase [Mariprofundaceae bacterium]